jgi:acetylornithine deacetylase
VALTFLVNLNSATTRMHFRKTILLLPCLSLGYTIQKPLGPSISTDPPALSTAERDQLHGLHKTLVNIESITGNEKAAGDWLAGYLESQGLVVEKQHVAGDRFNVLAYPSSADVRSPRTLLTSHIDTVPPFIPYSLKANATEAWGRGTVDAKACVAAQTLAALRILARAGESPPLLALLFVVGEERGGDGMQAFSADPRGAYSAVVFGEPTEGRLARAHKGLISPRVEVRGRASHSGYPWLGLSATDLLVRALARLTLLERLLPGDHALFGPGRMGRSTVNVGTVSGGVAPNVLAESASADLAIRIAKGEPEDIREAVARALAPLVREAERGGGSVEVSYSGGEYGPVAIDADDVPGFETTVVNYGTDIPNLKLKEDHKTYLYGPGSIHLAHGPDEHLALGELEEAVLAYERIVAHQL